MPTYEYRCDTCGEVVEAVQGFHDAPLTDCPNCADGRLRKLFGNVGVVFKGSGFYRTDSRAEGKAGTKNDADGASSAKKSDGSTDTKSSSDASKKGGAAGASSSGSSATASTPKAAAS